MIKLCLNLYERPDRWAQAQAEFKRVGLTGVERLLGISGPNGPLAFNQSVYKCMVYAQETAPGENLLLFEDDVVFETWGGVFEMPENFMTVQLGCNIIGPGDWQMPTPYSQTLAVVHNSWQSHATIYSPECIDYIIARLRIDSIREGQLIFDDWMRTTILPMGRSYVCKPMIAYQRPNYSNIWHREADYTGVHIEGNKYLKTI